MAKRTAVRRANAGKKKAKRPAASTRSPRKAAKKAAKQTPRRKASAKKKAPAVKKKAAKKAGKTPVARAKPKGKSRSKQAATAPGKVARLNRTRKILDDDETLQTPPSSLDMDRHGSAVRTGRAGMALSQRNHQGMAGTIQGGDVDVDIEDAYFTGEEAPGGDNPTPDQDIVEDIGKALGVTYEDNEELKASDKVIERDKHRWELDPASAEDYTEHDKD